MNDAVTIGERYRNATISSNLKIESRRTGDADLLVAAGWADSLGIKLYRLAGEFDQIATDLHRIETQTDAILVMGHLKTLNQTMVSLVQFAMDAAPRWGVKLETNVLAIVVGKALSAWLDPNCPRCGGTGAIGGYDGKPANVCRRCGGSGKTKHGLGESDAERYFAHRLLSAMDSKMGEADSVMKRYLRNVE
jgi:hypothetical protein